MPAILPILNYPDLLDHSFTLKEQQIVDESLADGQTRHLLKLICQSPYSIPVPVKAAMPPARCRIEQDQVIFFVELTEGTLKHFDPDYKDYYYLIYEDTAIHKSVGEFVDKDARIKATKETCSTKKDGTFLPQPADIWVPEFKPSCKDKTGSLEVRKDCSPDVENMKR